MINKKLLKLLDKKDKTNIFILVIIKIFLLLLNLLVIGGFSFLFYKIIENKNYEKTFIVSSGIAFLVLVRFLLNYLEKIIQSKLGGKAKLKIRENLYRKLLKLPNGFKDAKTASLTQLATDGIENLDTYYSMYLPQFIYSLIAPVILFSIAVMINYKVALLMLFSIPIIPISIIIVSKIAKKFFLKYWDVYLKMGDSFFDNINGLKELLVFNYDKLAHNDMNKKSKMFRKSTMRVLTMQLVSIVVMDLVAYGVSGGGIILTLMEFPNTSFFHVPILGVIFLILIMVEFFLPLRLLGSYFHIAVNGVSAGKKIFSLLNEKEDTWGMKELKKIEAIKIKDLVFSYNENPFINNLNMNFKSGELISFVGLSGSGKSTITKLLLGDYKNYQGVITANNLDIKDLKKESLYKSIAYFGTDSHLFSKTIRENFYLLGKIQDEKIIESLKLVNLDYLVKEKGLDFLISPGAKNLSGGEKQRLILAIILANKKDVYIFDEPTSNIDIESEKIIIDNIYKLKKDSIVILVSHRLQNVIASDCIYFFESGNIKEKGTHKELISKRGSYYNMLKTQNALENGYRLIK